MCKINYCDIFINEKEWQLLKKLILISAYSCTHTHINMFGEINKWAQGEMQSKHELLGRLKMWLLEEN